MTLGTDGADLPAIRERLKAGGFCSCRFYALAQEHDYWCAQRAMARLGEALEAATRKAADRVFDYLNGDSWGVQDYAPEQFAHHDGREVEKPTRETVETALQMGFERGLMKARDLLLQAALKTSE